MDTTKLKERIYKELDELLECDNWDGRKLSYVYQLSDIAHWIMEMEQMTKETSKTTTTTK